MIDLHNHMLPGLDDGAHDWEQSLEMARAAVLDGVKTVVCTPHWVSGSFENSRPIVLKRVAALRKRLAERKIGLEALPGAELRIDSCLPKKIESGEILTINDNGRYALIEFDYDVLPQNVEGFFWEIQTRDITPIICHPERNLGIMRDPSRLYKWIEMGALTQITAASLLGLFGRMIREFTVFLLRHNMAHVLATDAHGLKLRSPRLFEGFRAAAEIVGEEYARDMVEGNPGRIIKGEPVVPRELIPIESERPQSLFRRFLSLFEA